MKTATYKVYCREKVFAGELNAGERFRFGPDSLRVLKVTRIKYLVQETQTVVYRDDEYPAPAEYSISFQTPVWPVKTLVFQQKK